MFSCLQILEAFLWFVLITLLNVTLIILTLSVRSEERFSRNAETELVCRLLLEKKKVTLRHRRQTGKVVLCALARQEPASFGPPGRCAGGEGTIYGYAF